MIYYIVKWMKAFSLTVSSFALTSLSHCFSVLFAFLYFKPFPNNQMHCEIDCHFNVFFGEIQLKKENFKSVVWVSEFGHSNRYTGLPNGLNTSLNNCYLNFTLDPEDLFCWYKWKKVISINCGNSTIVHELIPFFGSPRETKHNMDF